jgi:hypothetical protein
MRSNRKKAVYTEFRTGELRRGQGVGDKRKLAGTIKSGSVSCVAKGKVGTTY